MRSTSRLPRWSRMRAPADAGLPLSRPTCRRCETPSTGSSGTAIAQAISSIRALLNKSATPRQVLSINEITLEVIALTRSELDMNRVALDLQLADDLPLLTGDRV